MTVIINNALGREGGGRGGGRRGGGTIYCQSPVSYKESLSPAFHRYVNTHFAYGD